MELHALTIRDAFPLIQQVLSDAYKVDSHLFTHPYEDTSTIDRGFRKMLWGTLERPAAFTNFLAATPEYQMAVAKSSLGYYNILAAVSLDWHHPDFISIGPFSTEKITNAFIHRIISDQNLDAAQAHMAAKFYDILPLADLNEVLILTQHLLSAFIPEYHTVKIVYLNYSEESHEISPDETAFLHFTALSAEHYTAYLTDFLNALADGSTSQASQKLKVFLDANGTFNAASLYPLKRRMHELNTFCKGKLLTTPVPPSYTLKAADSFSLQIERSTGMEQLTGLPYQMVRKYCLLVKNNSLAGYSYLIRNVIMYIHDHLEEELSLSVIAAHFQKNASFLSSQFGKETGESLTSYIHRVRIETAVQLFNTTGLSVTEVAFRVGIDNLRYFSRLFREQIGVTPREYCRMLRTKA